MCICVILHLQSNLTTIFYQTLSIHKLTYQLTASFSVSLTNGMDP